MSKTTREALRRAQVRELVREAELPPDLDAPEAPDGHYDAAGERQPPSEGAAGRASFYHSLELDSVLRAQLENLAGRYEYARVLLNGLHDDGRVSQLAAWNARDALEDEAGRPWPSKIPGADGVLERKIRKLFDSVEDD